MTDVFISYAREDRPRAELIAQALKREGISAALGLTEANLAKSYWLLAAIDKSDARLTRSRATNSSMSG